MKRVAILGEGAWGTAVATLLAHNGYAVNVWCYHKELVEVINNTHKNERFLPGVVLSDAIHAVATIDEAVCDVEWVFEAIPIKYLRPVLQQAQSSVTSQQVWVVLSKGIEQKSLLFPTQLINQIFDKKVPMAVLAGPSFAMDLARKTVTAVTVAATDCTLGRVLQKMLANEYFRPYITTDVIGVQAGAALKNVITLGVGIIDGAAYSDNAKAFILTRGLHEMMQLVMAVGGQQETVYGLSGVGDLVLTAMGQLSRNLEVGQRLGRGQQLDTILKETGYIPEGINTVQSVYQLMQRVSVSLPICTGIYQVIFEQLSVNDFLKTLLVAPLDWECNIPPHG